MWRLLLLAGLCAILLCGVAQAQIERKAGSGGATEVRKPRRHAETRKERPSAAQLTPAQRALAAAIAKACQAQAGLGRQNKLSAAKQAPAPAPPAPVAPQPEAKPRPAPEPQPAAQPVAKGEQPKPSNPVEPEPKLKRARHDPPAPQTPQTGPPQARTSADALPAAPAAGAAASPGQQPQPEQATQPAADKPVADSKPAPVHAEQPDADGNPRAANQATMEDTATQQPPAAAPAEQVAAATPPAAPHKPAPQPPAPETKPAAPAPAESSTAQAPDAINSLDELAEARRERGPAEEATVPAEPPVEIKDAPATAAKPAGAAEPAAVPPSADAAQPPAPAKRDPAAEPAAKDQPAASTPPQPAAAASDDAAPVRRDPSELSSRRPQLKMTKREPPPAREAKATAPMDAISSADLTGAAEQAAESVISHADAVPAEPAVPVDGPASAVAMDGAVPAPAGSDIAPAAGFNAPFEPRDAGTSLSQLSAPHLAAPPSAPAQESAALPPAGQTQVEMLLPPPTAKADLIIAPLAVNAAAGTLAANYGSGAPIELVLPRDAQASPDYPIKPGLGEFSRGNPKKKQIALTFDDGPHPQFTSQILAVLAYHRTPATFFFTGLQAQKNPQWVRMAHQAGHEIGNHTYDHFRIPKLPRKEQEYQIDEYQRLIEGLTGVTPRFMRPPGGQLDKATQQLVLQRGMIVAMWDVALNDTKAGKSGRELLKTSLKGIRSGSVILAHDGIQSTIDMLPALITALRGEGYSFVTLSQLASGS